METKIRKIKSGREIKTVKEGNCILVENVIVNSIGLPYIHDLNDNKIKTLAAKVYTEKCGKIEKGYVVRPACRNINCISPNHLVLEEV